VSTTIEERPKLWWLLVLFLITLLILPATGLWLCFTAPENPWRFMALPLLLNLELLCRVFGSPLFLASEMGCFPRRDAGWIPVFLIQIAVSIALWAFIRWYVYRSRNI
jgi:hypothetical protein